MSDFEYSDMSENDSTNTSDSISSDDDSSSSNSIEINSKTSGSHISAIYQSAVADRAQIQPDTEIQYTTQPTAATSHELSEGLKGDETELNKPLLSSLADVGLTVSFDETNQNQSAKGQLGEDTQQTSNHDLSSHSDISQNSREELSPSKSELSKQDSSKNSHTSNTALYNIDSNINENISVQSSVMSEGMKETPRSDPPAADKDQLVPFDSLEFVSNVPLIEYSADALTEVPVEDDFQQRQYDSLEFFPTVPTGKNNAKSQVKTLQKGASSKPPQYDSLEFFPIVPVIESKTKVTETPRQGFEVKSEIRCKEKTYEQIAKENDITEKTLNIVDAAKLTCKDLESKCYADCFSEKHPFDEISGFVDQKTVSRKITKKPAAKEISKIETHFDVLLRKPRNDVINKRSVYEPTLGKPSGPKYSQKRLNELAEPRVEPAEYLLMLDKFLPERVKQSAMTGKISDRILQLTRSKRIASGPLDRPKYVSQSNMRRAESNTVINNLAKPKKHIKVDSDQALYAYATPNMKISPAALNSTFSVSPHLTEPTHASYVLMSRSLPPTVSKAALKYQATESIRTLARPKYMPAYVDLNPFAVKKSALKYKPTNRTLLLATPIVRQANS